MKIQETFEVDAPSDRVFSFLVDPERVVRCLPGAELLEAEDERTFRGRVRVKVGPVTGSFEGRAEFTELDEAERRVRMKGSGQEKGGGGSASMTMSSQVVELPDGGSEVRVDVDVDVVGKLVQFGRGMIEQVSRQMFQQFAGCVAERLAAPEGAEASGSGAGSDAEEAQEAQPVKLVPVVLRAIRDMLARVFGRPPARS